MANEQDQGGPVGRTPGRSAIWAGRIVGAVPVLLMAMSATMKLLRTPQVLESWGPHFGYPEAALLAIGVVELACAVIYAIPRTAVLGAILITGFLGGATATHVRVGEMAFVAPVILGVLAWAGLFLRDPRLRALLPLRRKA
jgi:DoxX-like family